MQLQTLHLMRDGRGKILIFRGSCVQTVPSSPKLEHRRLGQRSFLVLCGNVEGAAANSGSRDRALAIDGTCRDPRGPKQFTGHLGAILQQQLKEHLGAGLLKGAQVAFYDQRAGGRRCGDDGGGTFDAINREVQSTEAARRIAHPSLEQDLNQLLSWLPFEEMLL